MLQETTASVSRLQELNPGSLARIGDYGTFDFQAAVEPARRLIDLFKRLPIAALEDFPEATLQPIRQQADAIFNVVEQIRQFRLEDGNPAGTRQQIVEQLTNLYPSTWGILFPVIGYGAARVADFPRLEAQGRAAVQSINDRTSELLRSLDTTRQQADEALAAARRAAAEQGVSQQAAYFRDEALVHDREASTWKRNTTVLSIVLAVYAASSVFVHKWEYLRPGSTFESAQLITSKVLIFAVMSYVLILAAKNFLSHKHNAIVNRHRQNALMTFNALAEAAKDQAAKDIILTHAASCIFAPQETGYSRSTSGPDPAIARSMVSLFAKADTRSDGT